MPLRDWSRRPIPDQVDLRGRACRVARLSTADADSLFDSISADETDRSWTYMAYGPFKDATDFRAMVAQLLDNADQVVMGISPEDGSPHQEPTVLGMASYSRIKPDIGSVEVGGIMLGPALKRTTAATEAMYLMAKAVFDLGYRRYEWKCDALNAASQAAARRLGFTYEGTWRNATIYKGRNRDTAWFAMTDEDWAALEPEFERWLDPSNFVEGKQQFQLSDATARVLRRRDMQ